MYTYISHHLSKNVKYGYHKRPSTNFPQLHWICSGSEWSQKIPLSSCASSWAIAVPKIRFINDTYVILEWTRVESTWGYYWLGFWRGNPILYFSNLTSQLDSHGHLCRYLVTHVTPVLVRLLHTTRTDVLEVLGRFAKQCATFSLFLILSALCIRKDTGKHMHMT